MAPWTPFTPTHFETIVNRMDTPKSGFTGARHICECKAFFVGDQSVLVFFAVKKSTLL